MTESSKPSYDLLLEKSLIGELLSWLSAIYMIILSFRYPSVTGTSVLGVKFNGGVVIAADKLGSYGSMARFRDLSRILKASDYINVNTPTSLTRIIIWELKF